MRTPNWGFALGPPKVLGWHCQACILGLVATNLAHFKRFQGNLIIQNRYSPLKWVRIGVERLVLHEARVLLKHRHTRL